MARPKGTGSVFVTVRDRTDGNPGVIVFIGGGVYDSIGAPERVDLDAAIHADRWYICAGDRYTVVKPPSGQPRLSVGRTWADHIALEPGEYLARVNGNIIEFDR